jgi:putative Holliday junction resolvase
MKVLAIDYGLRNIGLALSDENGKIAGKLGNIINYGELTTAKELQRIIDFYKVEQIVLGYPYFNKEPSVYEDRLEPMEGQMEKKMKRLIKYLETEIKIGVELWDESYSSQFVEKSLRGKARKKSDSEVARYLLQEYLDHKILMKKIYSIKKPVKPRKKKVKPQKAG